MQLANTKGTTLLTLMLLAGSTFAAQARLVAPLANQGAIRGCSWSASASSVGKGFIFLAEYDESRILMNIDDKDVELKAVGGRGKLQEVGDILERTFQGGGVTVKARYKATWVCPKDSESCEVTRFVAAFEVSKGSQTQHIEATGDVGC